MNPIEFGTELFAKAKEMQTKTVRAMEVIAKIDAELSSMPEPFKMDFMCLVTRAIDKCDDMTRDCKTCEHSKDGRCAGTEICHLCMWESQYKEGKQNEADN